MADCPERYRAIGCYPPRNMPKPICELCHKNEATHVVWLNPEQSPIAVGGRYQVCDKCDGGTHEPSRN